MFDHCSKSFNTHLSFPTTFDDHPDSGVCSPPLWSPAHRHNNYPKAQVIARGQRELMDMVSKMPESCYELSLKDLVEVNTDQDKEPSKVVRKLKSDKWVDPIRNKNKSGFLLKLVFPVSLGAKKKTKDDSCVKSKGSWISPRPEDKDWWKIGLSESRGSHRGVSRINSGSSKSSGASSTRRNTDRSRISLRDENSGCLSFLWSVHLRD